MLHVETIQEAFGRIKGRAVLIGTTGLWMRGYDVEPHDIDFLVEVPQSDHFNDYGSTSKSFKTVVQGWPVDYIFADDDRKPYATTHPDIIEGVPVASVEDILGIKDFAGRPKDRDFLDRWYSGQIHRK